MKPVRRALLLFLLLAYTGQSLAAIGTPCLAMGSAAGGGASPADIDLSHDVSDSMHAGHHMGQDGQTQADSNSCCDGGFCSMSDCQSIASLPHTLFPVLATRLAIHAGPVPVSSPESATTSLYRPPIFC